ncbi:transketolase [Patescibacteria group bacterium]|nr:transketolase [Patescibacteria group bacterium]
MPQQNLPNLEGNVLVESVEELQRIANELRIDVLEMLYKAKSGHGAGSLGTAEIFACLYFSSLIINPKNPKDPKRDIFVLSNGHICPVLYATLAKKGFFAKEELANFRKINSLLQGHPSLEIPGIETCSGSLGQGLSIAAGRAFSNKMDNLSTHIYCMTSDGELNEGQTWEAAMFAPKYKLTNLTWIIDRNNIQISGPTEKIMPLENIREKLESFNWYVLEIDGNSVIEILSAFKMTKRILTHPSAIIAHTVPGKGVDFMENKPDWHGKAPNEEEKTKAIRQIRKLLN